MKLSDALRFPFRGPHAWPNIGFLLICFLIPVVGPMVAAGFQCTVEKMVVFNPQADAPRFDFGKFTFYLQRGVMPFVVSMLSMLVFLPVFIAFFGVSFLAILLAAPHHPVIAVVLVLGAALCCIISLFVVGVLLTPLVFRAGVQGVFVQAFEKAFILDFLRRMGWQTLWINAQVFLFTLPLLLIACVPLASCAAVGVLLLMQAHIRAQLYRGYLARGGTPLEIQPDPPEAAFPVVMENAPRPSPPSA